MKAVLVCGSPRLNGNTQKLLELAEEVLQENNIDTELILLHGKDIKPCIACNRCRETKDRMCSIKDDDFHTVFNKILEADALVIGSPVYFGSATSQTTCLLHRTGYVSRGNGRLLSGKVGAPIVVARRAGHNFTYAQLVLFLTMNDMTVAGSTYWNIAFGKNPGEVMDDEEGVETIRRCAQNISMLLSKK
ncbi:MAG: flavodoxin family protein [Spirochaetota bacterium]|nr:MAG: flavodoxin family protein [Spirochaetota bacterium]